MAMRVADSTIYQSIINNLSNEQSNFNNISEELSTQQSINKPSDNPVGMTELLNYRSSQASISTYQTNIQNCSSWLTATESALTGINTALNSIQSTAMAQDNSTSSSADMSAASAALQPMIDEILSLANSTCGGQYVFSGTNAGTQPFPSDSTAMPAQVSNPVAARGNTFDGTVSAGGTYTGTANATYVVKIVQGGTLANASYQVSSDGGKTWGAVTTGLGAGTISLGDGATMTFADNGSNHLAANDVFSVDAYAPGYYQGNGQDLSAQIGQDSSFNYGISGQSVFTDQVNDNVDMFGTLNDLQTALQNNDSAGIQQQLQNLSQVQNQVNNYISDCGAKQNQLTAAGTNLTNLNQNITQATSNLDDANMATLMTQFTSQQVALEASYELSSQIGQLSIVNYLSSSTIK